jgi:methyltransferase (TIGR00027 family)
MEYERLLDKTVTPSKSENTFVKVFRFVLFIPVQIVFIPLIVPGLLAGLYKEMVIGKKLGVSFSAIKALQYRWNAHYFNLRPDALSVAFIKKFSCESHFGLWSLMGALVVSKRLFGFTVSALKSVKPEDTFDATAVTRVKVFDEIMEKYINDDEQIVIPGAGFDLIALKYLNGHNVKVFELDSVNTLNIKIDTLRKAGIEHSSVSYIPVNYETESWTDKLKESGFDKTKKTLFLWQSVSLFLEPEIVKDSLSKMAGLCSEGSIVVQDFYSKAFLNGEISKMAQKQFNLFEKQGEPVKFGLEMSDNPEKVIKTFLNDFGIEMTNCIRFGKNIGIEPFYCIIEARKK